MLLRDSSVFQIGLLIALGASASSAVADCLDEAASYHNVYPALARAIAMHESRMNPHAISAPNGNGTYDIGLMQINSSWLPMLARYGISHDALLDGCVNAYVGTWILQQNIRQYGYNWEAVGAYNAASPAKRQKYASAIYDQLTRVMAGTSPATAAAIMPAGLAPIAVSPIASRTVSLAAAPRTGAHAARRSHVGAFEATPSWQNTPVADRTSSLAAYEVESE